MALIKNIGDEAGKLLKRVIRHKDPIVAELLINWGKVVGVKFASFTYPLKTIKFKEKNQYKKLLIVNASNSSLAMEFSFQQDIIIERIAVYMGYKAVHKIQVRTL